MDKLLVQNKTNEIITNENINKTEELDYASMILDEQFTELTNKLIKYIEENPSSTDYEQNDFFKQLILDNYDEEAITLQKKYVKSPRYDYADKLPVVSSLLGPTEKQVFNSNVAKGALCLNYAAAAEEMTEKTWYNTFGYHNDNGDAYRHALWNAYTAHNCGSTYAKQFADAHEKDFPNVPLENEMDLFNNSVGRTIGSKSYSGSNAAQVNNLIRLAVTDAVKQGQMKRFHGNDIGKLTYLTKTNSNGIK